MYSKEEFDIQKTKVLKYILYKKRSEYEIRMKFSKIINEDMLDDIIAYLIEAGYINDTQYIERAVNEFIALKKMCIREIKYKLMNKGISKDLIEEYITNHQEELEDYELESAKEIVIRKEYKMQADEIRTFLIKKGYQEENVKEAMEELEKTE